MRRRQPGGVLGVDGRRQRSRPRAYRVWLWWLISGQRGVWVDSFDVDLAASADAAVAEAMGRLRLLVPDAIVCPAQVELRQHR